MHGVNLALLALAGTGLSRAQVIVRTSVMTTSTVVVVDVIPAISTSTQVETQEVTVLGCPPWVTDCPVRSDGIAVVTATTAVSTTVCPLTLTSSHLAEVTSSVLSSSRTATTTDPYSTTTTTWPTTSSLPTNTVAPSVLSIARIDAFTSTFGSIGTFSFGSTGTVAGASSEIAANQDPRFSAFSVFSVAASSFIPAITTVESAFGPAASPIGVSGFTSTFATRSFRVITNALTSFETLEVPLESSGAVSGIGVGASTVISGAVPGAASGAASTVISGLAPGVISTIISGGAPGGASTILMGGAPGVTSTIVFAGPSAVPSSIISGGGPAAVSTIISGGSPGVVSTIVFGGAPGAASTIIVGGAPGAASTIIVGGAPGVASTILVGGAPASASIIMAGGAPGAVSSILVGGVPTGASMTVIEDPNTTLTISGATGAAISSAIAGAASGAAASAASSGFSTVFTPTNATAGNASATNFMSTGGTVASAFSVFSVAASSFTQALNSVESVFDPGATTSAASSAGVASSAAFSTAFSTQFPTVSSALGSFASGSGFSTSFPGSASTTSSGTGAVTGFGGAAAGSPPSTGRSLPFPTITSRLNSTMTIVNPSSTNFTMNLMTVICTECPGGTAVITNWVPPPTIPSGTGVPSATGLPGVMANGTSFQPGNLTTAVLPQFTGAANRVVYGLPALLAIIFSFFW